MLDGFPSKPRDSNAATPTSRSATASPHHNGSVAGSSKSQVGARNGSATTSLKTDARPNGPSKLKPKALSSAVVVTTVKKKASAPPSTSHSTSSSNGASSVRKGTASTNALSEERRKRIAEDRERIERERARKDAASREEAARASKHLAHKRRKLGEDTARHNGSGASTPRHKNGRSRTSTSDEDESSALSSESDTDGAKRRKGSVARTKKTGRPGSASPVTSSPGGYKKRGREGVTAYYCVPRDNLVETEAFAKACEENGCGTTFVSSKELVGISGMSKYGVFFRELDTSDVTLEYPAIGATEEFRLLCPKSTDEYDPISDLLRAVYAISAAYFTDDQREEHLGSLDDLETGSTAGQQLTAKQLEAGLAGTKGTADMRSTPSAQSREGSVALKGSPSAAGEVSAEVPASKTAVLSAVAHVLGAGTPLSQSRDNDSPAPESVDSPVPANGVDGTLGASAQLTPAKPTYSASILRSFTKARNRRDGPLFLQTLQRFNETLREFKEEGKIVTNLQQGMAKRGVPEVVWRVIQEQCYARSVGPKVEELGRYTAFSDNVYGELLPRFMSEIAQLTHLKQDSVLLDLGSGVGNLLVQAALQTGCKALGCEMMKIPTDLADLQLKEARTRWAMWSLRGGEMDSWRGNFCEDPKVGKALLEADVVLVNNYAFLPKTNDSLSLQFLDLKDGAHIVSLKPFVPPDFRLTERTLSSPLAILRVDERIHTTGCVSWADRSGKYYIQTVDRTLLRKFDAGRVGTGDVSRKKYRAIPEDDEDGI